MSNTGNRRRICIVVSDFMTVQAFLQDQIRALSEVYEITVVANTDDRDALRRLGLNAELVGVSIPRPIRLWRDAGALLNLYSLFRKRKFDLVHSITPKAGLLSMAAGRLAGVRIRIHTFTGQVWATQSGLRRFLLKLADQLTSSCASQVLADSQSQLEFLIDEGVVSTRKCRVLANGSISGVDVSRFCPDAAARERIRNKASIPEDAPVFLFVGRLKKDKGVLDLAKAFAHMAAQRRNAHLVCIGPDEDGLETQMRNICSSCVERLHFVGQTRFPEQYMAASDVLCLPSYREGFGSVVIEAAATGVPAIASRIYGLTDSVQDGVTGRLHQPGNWEELADAMESLAANRSLREQLGRQARERANKDFAVQVLTDALLAFYSEQLSAGGSASTSFSRALKRAFDLLIGIAALLALSPALVAIAVVIRILLGPPILFRQCRPGLQGQLFTCLKFRTMTEARDAQDQLLPDAQRLTALGRVLRSTSLDELPELINVIRGEMSLVGPRPLLAQYLNRYTPEQMRRHEVKPGITGWAQIHGRNALDWNQKLTLDLWYVDHHSFWLDLSILVRTAGFVLRREGITQRGHPTMPEFLGTSIEQEKGNA
jgi:lipopolysaccharide/colanic/teichoic acid biosynthesis glycosyltransferase/glycosyltransferase involved in cell wall biosynthesis